MPYAYRSAIGQDSHRYCEAHDPSAKPLILAGERIGNEIFCSANSDGDVLFHAVTNAVSGITCKNVLGRRADEMCRSGITDSRAYLELALSELDAVEPVHLSCSIEAKRPHLAADIERIRSSLARAMQLDPSSVGITATSGEGLSGMGRGEGIQVLCILTVRERLPAEGEL